MSEKTNWQEPTKDQITAWKKEHNTEDIHVIKVKDEKDGNKWKKAYLRTPNIDDLVRASGSEKAKPGTYAKSLFENCKLDAHPDIIAKSKLYAAAMMKTNAIEVAAEAELEKL